MKGNELFKWNIHLQGNVLFIYKEMSCTYEDTGFSYKEKSYSMSCWYQEQRYPYKFFKQGN